MNFNKILNYSVMATLALSLNTSCNTATSEEGKDEVHNAATQEIPEESKDLIGRWDITVDKQDKQAPSWLEVKLSGISTLVGQFVSEAGSARPVSHIKLEGNKFSFEIPTQWERGSGLIKVEGTIESGKIQGTITSNTGTVSNFTGEKAPYLLRESAGELSSPIVLFNGKDLTGWQTSSVESQWEVKDGILINKAPGANLISDEKFEDFKLEVEFRYGKEGNSGIYLRGRYEVQIEDAPADRHPGNLYYSAVYGFLSPSEIVTNGPGEWNKYEITLRGRMVTIVSNGKTVINNQEIPGITGGALDSKEGEPGPIYLQGDHTGVEFRKIVITPIK